MKSLLLSIVFSATLVISSQSLALATKPPADTTNLLGNDVSYPQCGGKLPTGQAFGIVGVNNGLANTTNPCLATQLAWAAKSTGVSSQPKVSLYVNTANPGLAATKWPQDNSAYGMAITNPYGTCNGAEGAACAYVYGWTRAYEDATLRGVNNPTSYKWWLDVETGNSWSQTDLVANAASLEGMVDYFKSIGALVGVYSTSYQWNAIVGMLAPNSSLQGLDSWLAGALTKRGAESNCKNSGLTPTSSVVLTQFVSKGYDYDVACK